MAMRQNESLDAPDFGIETTQNSLQESGIKTVHQISLVIVGGVFKTDSS